MINTIYAEEEALEYDRAKEILKRFPKARVIPIKRYGEVFNPKAQSFRLQKTDPALILAVKNNGFVLPAPLNYGIGGQENYYFSHMMNCLYDCRYCFLQGMFQSANYVVFVNFDDFFDHIKNKQNELGDKSGWFFSGYDCDSLALEPVTHFIDAALDTFEQMPNSWLELRTKSTQIRHLLKRKALANCVVAFSLSPQSVISSLEHKTPSLEKRLKAANQLASKGWPIGLRFDPIIAIDDYQHQYAELFKQTAQAIPSSAIHSISLGPFRLPKPFHKKLTQLYPEEPLFATDIKTVGNMISHGEENEQEMLQFCKDKILDWVDESKFFPCVELL